MEILSSGSYGSLDLGSGISDLTTHLADALVSSSAAGAVGYLAAKSNLAGKGGKLAGAPIPLVGALGLATLAATGLAGDANHYLIAAAKGCLNAQAAMFGVKAAYSGSGKPATIEGAPRMAALPHGNAYAMNPGLYGMPHMGATPATEAMLGRAGLQAG